MGNETSEQQSAGGASSALSAYVLNDVCRSYGNNEVLKNLNLAIPNGQRVAIIGPSGAGKTTLLRLLGAVLWPTSGTVEILGKSSSSLRGRALRAIRRRVGFLYQSENLVPGLRVVHNVLMGKLGSWSIWRALLSLFWPQQKEAAIAALKEVELEDKLWDLPDTLSGGQQQRVAIARLIVQNPDILLADEPVSSLDIRLGRDVIRLLLKRANETSTSVIVSLHSLDLLNEGFDRVIAFKNGELIWDGNPAELNQTILKEVYGVEYQTLHLETLRLGADN
ncbi:MAG: phosphonate ABC transporter ATP-binding protein [Planctomycetota bacterium]